MRKKTILVILLLIAGSMTSLWAQQEDQTFEVNGVSFTMKYVEGGKIKLPSGKQQVEGLYIGETEVTQELWQAVMGKNPSNYQGGKLRFNYGTEPGDNRPVENVSYVDCHNFINKLNELTGKQFRLPTPVEWLYAAKGGNKSKDYKYSGSNNPKDVAWYEDNSQWSDVLQKFSIGIGYRPHQVKKKQPNELGIYDMSGNVSEWVEELDERGERGVVCGGDSKSSEKRLELNNATKVQNVKNGDVIIGFRLALTE